MRHLTNCLPFAPGRRNASWQVTPAVRCVSTAHPSTTLATLRVVLQKRRPLRGRFNYIVIFHSDVFRRNTLLCNPTRPCGVERRHRKPLAARESASKMHETCSPRKGGVGKCVVYPGLVPSCNNYGKNYRVGSTVASILLTPNCISNPLKTRNSRKAIHNPLLPNVLCRA